MYELIAFNYNNITGNLFKSISILLSNTQLNGNNQLKVWDGLEKIMLIQKEASQLLGWF